MTEVQNKEDGNGDVGSQEVGDVPVLGEEHLEAVGQGEQSDEEENNPGQVRLEWSLEGELLEEVVVNHGLAEADVSDENDDPSNLQKINRLVNGSLFFFFFF